jgi:nitrite reductase (NO-forming)
MQNINQKIGFTGSLELLAVLLLAALLLSACASASVAEMPMPGGHVEISSAPGDDLTPTVSYTLVTSLVEGRMGFTGVGGEIDGQFNPTLTAAVGDVVEIILRDGDGMEHDWVLAELNAATDHVQREGDEARVVFAVTQGGNFTYFCSLPGHRQAGMEGQFVVTGGVTPEAIAGYAAPPATAVPAQPPVEAPSIVRPPADLPAPVGSRAPQTVRVDLETVEIVGQLMDGVSYTYWTFNGLVPGPLLRVRVGDTLEVHLKNAADSTMIHSVDFHAATGPGGGATVTQAKPGEEKVFTFKTLSPGLYVYHCATPMVAHHIANGMYGLILVEPEGGLPPVDKEFYVMQGEIYTTAKFGATGAQEVDIDALLDEDPEYFVFNGAVGALTNSQPLEAAVGETVRIFFGVGGPNFTSSFHVIGEIFDRVYNQASLTADPLTDVQTTLVPAGGATMVEFKLDVPGRYLLVDHALARMERGLMGYLIATGPDAPDIFHSDEAPSAAGH